MIDIVQTLVSAVISIGDTLTIPTPSGGSVSVFGFLLGVFVVGFSVKHLLPGG